MIYTAMVHFYKPWYYTVSHTVTGFISAWYPIVGILALVYQLTQLVFNVRFFIIEGKILHGNSVQHTFKKLVEVGLGYCVGYIMKNKA
jgi:hypothetical protein